MGVVAAMIIGIVWSVFGAPSVFAANESYSWKDYSTIGAKNGLYSLNGKSTEGGVPALEFKQSTENPNLFEANFGADDCDLKISLTLAQDGKTGVASATRNNGSCNPAELDAQVTIGNVSLITSKASTDSATILKSLYDKECTVRDESDPATANQQEEECKKGAQAKYEAAVAECKVQNDYAQSPQLANKYLDCLSQKLGVERPSDKKPEEKSPSEKTKCAISDNIGWMVCQILQFEAWVADYSFTLLSQFLTVDPLKDQINTGAAVGQNPAEEPTSPQPTAQNCEATPANAPEVEPNQPQASQQCQQQQANLQLPDTEENETYTHAAWRFMLGFTNLIFVFVFLFAVISYLTGWGVTQYNIKSLLPRYIVTAILVNMSFFICALAIDVSNILGKSVQDTIVSFTSEEVSQSTSWETLTDHTLSRDVTDSDPASAENSGQETTNGQPAAPDPNEERAQREESQGPNDRVILESEKPSAVKIAGVTLFGAAVLVVLLIVLVPLMTAALIAMIVTLLVLLFRQAAIIVLVVISPIAFALYLLPNTRSWFTKWRTLFVTLLLLYPLVSLIYGASYLAATVIQDRALENDDELMQIFSLAIMVMPLFMTPALMKLGGGVLSRFTGMVNNPNKGPFDRLRKGAAGYQEYKRNRREALALAQPSERNIVGKFGFMKRYSTARRFGRAQTNHLLDDEKKKYLGGLTRPSGAERGLTNRNGFRDEAIEEAFADAASELNDVTVGEMRAATARWQSENMTQGQYEDMALTGKQNGKALSPAEHAAAAQAALNGKNEEVAKQIIAKSGSFADAIVRQAIAQKAGQYGAHFGGAARADIAEGKINSIDQINQRMNRAAASGKLSPETMTKQTGATLAQYQSLIDSRVLTPAAKENLQKSARLVKSNPKLYDKLNTEQKTHIDNWSGPS